MVSQSATAVVAVTDPTSPFQTLVNQVVQTLVTLPWGTPPVQRPGR